MTRAQLKSTDKDAWFEWRRAIIEKRYPAMISKRNATANAIEWCRANRQQQPNPKVKCSDVECDRFASVHGMCHMHYMRLRRAR